VLEVIVLLTAPPLSSCIFTVDPGLPAYVHFIVCVVPLAQLSPPLGAVTVMYCVNVAVTAVSAFMVTLQVPVPEHPPPLHPAKSESEFLDAVRVTEVPVLKPAEHVEPQLIPVGELVTVPLPVPAFVNVRIYLLENVALIV
jgi:hypothetical protein